MKKNCGVFCLEREEEHDQLRQKNQQQVCQLFLDKLNLIPQSYAMLTLHRPSNVDSRENFKKMLNIIDYAQKKLPVVFPMHPRTLKQLDLLGLKRRLSKLKRVVVTDPLGYNDFIKLVAGARFILTDSGGIQEEATMLKVPCITLRENTERPETINVGANTIGGILPEGIVKASVRMINIKRDACIVLGFGDFILLKYFPKTHPDSYRDC